MKYNIIAAAVAAVSGLLVVFSGYLFSKHVLIKAPQKYSLITVLRQAIQVGFLVLVYFIGTRTQLADLEYLLVGAVLGMTVPMIFFTKKLLLINDSASTGKKKKEADTDG